MHSESAAHVPAVEYLKPHARTHLAPAEDELSTWQRYSPEHAAAEKVEHASRQRLLNHAQ